MTEAQLHLFPAFRALPLYDESDPRADRITTVAGAGNYRAIRECATLQEVEDCLKDQALLDKIAADQKFAAEVLKVQSTPTFFINGEMLKGDQSFEEFAKRINSLLKS